MVNAPLRLLVAASGTGGHLFPALATAQELTEYQIEWLGVPNRLETELVPADYPLHTVGVEGFQQRLGLGTLVIAWKLMQAVWQVRRLLQQGGFQGVLTTGGYIAAPAILAARSLGVPVIFHESNVLPGKVTRWFSRWCRVVAIGFEASAPYLPQANTVYVGTPVRSQFLTPQVLDLEIPEGVPVIAVVGGSQGAVAVNQLVRQCAPGWMAAGAWIVHQTGEQDPDAGCLEHRQYLSFPFYDQMAALFQRADLVIGRAGAGTLTELAITGTPSILIPYPYAAEDHQRFNAEVFVRAGAGILFNQKLLTAQQLEKTVLELLNSPDQLKEMSVAAKSLGVPDSAKQLAGLVRQQINI